MQSVAKFDFSLAAQLGIVRAEFLEGHVHVTPYTVSHERTKNFRNVGGNTSR